MPHKVTETDASISTPADSAAPQGGVQSAAPTTSTSGRKGGPIENPLSRAPYDQIVQAR
jgi:hypothetical protein